jgi:hypothetical protein
MTATIRTECGKGPDRKYAGSARGILTLWSSRNPSCGAAGTAAVLMSRSEIESGSNPVVGVEAIYFRRFPVALRRYPTVTRPMWSAA